MTQKEILEFLELPESAKERDIISRLDEKLHYFQRLVDNAPNEFLKKLHAGNIQKIKDIQKQIGSTANVSPSAAPGPIPAYQQPNYNPAPPPTPSYFRPQPAVNQFQHPSSILAWLVTHTENMPTQTFPLYGGRTFIGRHQQPNGNTIILDQDAYVSRLHGVIDIQLQPTKITIADASIFGKASKNGIFINGNEHRIQSIIPLQQGDTVQVGMTKMMVKINNTPLNQIVQQVEESEYMKTVVIDIF